MDHDGAGGDVGPAEVLKVARSRSPSGKCVGSRGQAISRYTRARVIRVRIRVSAAAKTGYLVIGVDAASAALGM